MSEYKGIKGFQVQTRTEDPSPTEAQAGDFYYNSTTGQFKTVNTGGAPIGTWASGGNMNTARSYLAGFGSQTSAIGATGYVAPPTVSNVENYNGTSWTEVAEVNSALNHRAGAGVIGTNGILIGGGTPSSSPRGKSVCETWDGSSWTEVADLGTAGYGIAGSGTSTAALGSGRYDYPPGANTGKTESWDGSSWTEVNDLNTARHYGGQTGPYTAAIRVGGYPSPTSKEVETWDGTSWTTVAEKNNTSGGRLSCSGTQTDALTAFVPNPTPAAYVEHWNGTAWTEIAENATKRQSGDGGKSSATSAIIFGGRTAPAYSNSTEEFDAAEVLIKTVTTS